MLPTTGTAGPHSVRSVSLALHGASASASTVTEKPADSPRLPTWTPDEIPDRIAQTHAEVRALLSVLRTHDLADPLNCCWSQEANEHLRAQVGEVPDVPDIELPEGIDAADVLSVATHRLDEGLARAILHLLPPELVTDTIARFTRPVAPPRPAPRSLSLADLAAGAVPNDGDQVEQDGGYWTTWRTPPPKPPHVVEREELWARWLEEHDAEIEAAEVPAPRKGRTVTRYAAVCEYGSVIAWGGTPALAWARAVEVARWSARRHDIVEDPPAHGADLVRHYTDDLSIVKVSGPARVVRGLLGDDR